MLSFSFVVFRLGSVVLTFEGIIVNLRSPMGGLMSVGFVLGIAGGALGIAEGALQLRAR